MLLFLLWLVLVWSTVLLRKWCTWGWMCWWKAAVCLLTWHSFATEKNYFDRSVSCCPASVLWQVVELSVVSTLQCSDNLWAVGTSTSPLLQKRWYQRDVKTSFFGASEVSLQAARGPDLLISDTSEMSSAGGAAHTDRVHEQSLCSLPALLWNAPATCTAFLGVVLLLNVICISSSEMYWIVEICVHAEKGSSRWGSNY